ncbi:hypothetical protein TNIN_127911 [Trichonephila inaurata madagascariensis]|uniref:Uncharacterized protein n=1 Tax=Trichonephila inaurata madagascariensis TaxID=2747483 RepID=A0A8X6YTS4_9ARAC|nr:hypothetical protein TNIN_127911 [Trichonephila inaurata madagascariensis]
MERSFYHLSQCLIRSQGCSEIVGEDRSERPVLIAIKSAEQQVEELICADRRVTFDNIETVIECSYGLVYSIMLDCLNFQKVCAQCVW